MIFIKERPGTEMDKLVIAMAVLVILITECDQASGKFLFGEPPPTPLFGTRLYQGVENRTLPNYAMVAARDFRDVDSGSPGNTTYEDGLNDGLWCQSAYNAVTDIGSWQFPNGSPVSITDSDESPIHMAHSPGQVGLLRDKGLFSDQGMYMCTIPNEKGVNETLVVWAGTNDAYDGENGCPVPNPVVSNIPFISSKNPRDSPYLILSFDVNTAPPTYVMCNKEEEEVQIVDLYREVIAGVYNASELFNSTLELINSTSELVISTPVTRVCVTLKPISRQAAAGIYQCTVSVFRASGANLTTSSTAPIRVTVTNAPSDLTAMRTEYNTVELSWNSPSNNTPPVAGYEVFYVLSGESNTQSGGTVTQSPTNIKVSNILVLGNTYDFFVVAYSAKEKNVLPSEHSNTATIVLDFPYLYGPLQVTSVIDAISISWTHSVNVVPSGYALTATCTLLCDDAPLPHTTFVIGGNDTSTIVSGLLPGSKCNISLTAKYGNNKTSNTLMVIAETKFQIPSSTPTGLKSFAMSAESANVTWNELPCSDWNGLIDYVIQYSMYDNSTATIIVAGGTTTTHALSGLTACTNYSLSIAAMNNAGSGAYSPPVHVITMAIDGPGRVSFGVITSNLTGIRIPWIPPSNENGKVVNYIIQFTYNGTTANITTSDTWFELAGVPPGTSVEFAVRAVTVCGALGILAVAVPSTKPVAVVNSFSVEAINSATVRVSWTVDDSPYLEHFTVYYYLISSSTKKRKRENSEETMMFTRDSLSGMITLLEEGEDYLFSITVTFKLNGKLFEGEKIGAIPIDGAWPLTSTTTVTSALNTLEVGKNNVAAIVGGITVALLTITVIVIVAMHIVLILVKKRYQVKESQASTDSQSENVGKIF